MKRWTLGNNGHILKSFTERVGITAFINVAVISVYVHSRLVQMIWHKRLSASVVDQTELINNISNGVTASSKKLQRTGALPGQVGTGNRWEYPFPCSLYLALPEHPVLDQWDLQPAKQTFGVHDKLRWKHSGWLGWCSPWTLHYWYKIKWSLN